MLRSIAVFLCLIVSFLCPQTGSCQPAGGDEAGKEKPSASGLDALELVRVVYIPHKVRERLRLMLYDINPKNPKDIVVSINTIDRGNKTFFLPVGEDIPLIDFVRVEDIRDGKIVHHAKYKVTSFKKIEAGGKDVSEVTITDNENGAEFVLPLKEIVDVTDDRYAIFRYKWQQLGGKKTDDFSKRSGQTFTLPPEDGKKYKVIAIEGETVVIELPDGTRKTLTVPK